MDPSSIADNIGGGVRYLASLNELFTETFAWWSLLPTVASTTFGPAVGLLIVSGMTRLIEYFIQNGQAVS